ncbi:MAG TPA: nuclear transport factor 2 family protein [Actinomycetota bacterium]|nr:nuclear transport factor 2 family protein [Actinomycetota bacterium]
MHPNEVLVRGAYEAMTRGDGAALAELIGPETRWVIRGEGPLAGTYIGRDEIFGFWKQVAAKTGGGLRLELDDVLANDERAVALVTARGSRKDRRLEERQVVVYEIAAGRFTSATFIYERPEVYDAFWLD